MNLLGALLWICGLLLAGSDGGWMPWPNIFGLLMFIAGCEVGLLTGELN